MDRTEVRITGLGGQGVVLAGIIIGRAVAVNAGKHATLIQSFGPEARGASCSATLALADEPILYPYIQRPHVLVAMSSEGYTKYVGELRDDGVLIYESDLVQPDPKPGQAAYGIPSTRIAEALGRLLVQNIVMVGFIAAATHLVPVEMMRDAVKESVPAGTEALNLKAFDAGWQHFQETYGTGEPVGAEAVVAVSPQSAHRSH
jgi:2-oxoglutarate ferredoxin oxidoreductase subunit gamma